LLKVGIDLAVGNGVPLFSPTVKTASGWRMGPNLLAFFQGDLFSHPLWINAGLLAALALLPGPGARDDRMVKTVAAAFTLATLLAGAIKEYRIWFELAPLAAWAVLNHAGLKVSRGAAAPSR